MSRSVLIALSLVFTAAAIRLAPHPFNFTPLGAMGLFCAAWLRRPWGLAVPFVAIFLSDLILNNVIYSALHPNFTWFSSPWVYLAFTAVVAVGLLAFRHKVSAARVVAASLLGSVAFFLISNLSTFLNTSLYPKSFAGLLTCYTAGLPFFQNTVMGDLFYSAVLFGAYAFYQRTAPKMAV